MLQEFLAAYFTSYGSLADPAGSSEYPPHSLTVIAGCFVLFGA